MFTSADEVLRFIKDEGVKFVDVRFCDLPGSHAALQRAGGDAAGRVLHRGPDVRRLVDPRLPGDPRVGHEARSRTSRRPTSTRSGPAKTLNVNFSIVDPFTDEPYSRDPRKVAAKAEAYLKSHRHRRHRVLRPGGRVLHLRRRPLRDQAERRLLLHRLDRGRLEHRPRRGGRQPRLQDPVQGRLLPGAAGRPLRRPARRDEPRARSTPASRSSARTTRSAPPARPRSTTSSTRCWHAGRRACMLFKYIIKNVAWAQRQDRDVHAEAAVRRQRLGHALPPVAVEGRRAAVLRRARLRAGCRTWRAGTSAACCTTRRRCWRSPTRR